MVGSIYSSPQSINWLARLVLSPDASVNGIKKAQSKASAATLHQASLAPRDDQKLAIKNVCKGFQKHKRGKLILPCGVGKTLTSLWIKEQLKPKTTVFFAPSLALIAQAREAWEKNHKKDYDYLCVCSDSTVMNDKDADEIQMTKEEIDPKGRVTNESGEIKTFLESGTKDKVIFCTYQSFDKLAEAAQGKELDLGICDEAHVTTGRENQMFTQVHDDEKIQFAKRLYMTATPRVASAKARETDELLIDMNNEKIYGPEFHYMPFADAIDKGLICDYEIIGVGVSEAEVRKQYGQDFDFENPPEVFYNIALDKFMRSKRESPTNRAIVFHNRCADAENFANKHRELYPQVPIAYLDGTQSVKYRKAQLEEFSKSEEAVLSNAKCLGLGVDLQGAHVVMYTKPKSSTIDIVQSASRSMRKDRKDSAKTKGYIVVPVLHRKKEKLQSAISESSYQTLVDVLVAMGAQDSRLLAALKTSNKGDPKPRDPRDPEPKTPVHFQDLGSLEKGILVDVIDRSSRALKPLFYKNFDEAAEAIRAKQAARPKNVRAYLVSQDEFKEKGLDAHIKIGYGALRTLAIKNGKLSEENAAYTNLANLIWGGEIKVNKARKEYKTFSEAVRDIRVKQPVRPSRVVAYLDSQGELRDKGLAADIGIGYVALRTLAFKSGKLPEKKATTTNLANLIWPKQARKECKTFNEAVQAIRAKQPFRPGGIAAYLDSQGDFKGKGLKADIGFGATVLKILAIKNGKLTEKNATHANLANLIWHEEAKKEYKSFNEAAQAIRAKQPVRPGGIAAYLTSQGAFKDNGLATDIDIGYKALINLAIQSRKLTEENATHANLAKLIWG